MVTHKKLIIKAIDKLTTKKSPVNRLFTGLLNFA